MPLNEQGYSFKGDSGIRWVSINTAERANAQGSDFVRQKPRTFGLHGLLSICQPVGGSGGFIPLPSPSIAGIRWTP
jgi:hypothetical protein